MAHRGGAQVKVFQIETGGHLLRVGGAEPLKSPLRLSTKAKPLWPPEDSQGEVSCPSFTPLGARADWPLPPFVAFLAELAAGSAFSLGSALAAAPFQLSAGFKAPSRSCFKCGGSTVSGCPGVPGEPCHMGASFCKSCKFAGDSPCFPCSIKQRSNSMPQQVPAKRCAACCASKDSSGELSRLRYLVLHETHKQDRDGVTPIRMSTMHGTRSVFCTAQRKGRALLPTSRGGPHGQFWRFKFPKAEITHLGTSSSSI